MSKDLQGNRPAIKAFCGVQALSRRLSMLVKITDDKLAAGEIIAVVGELDLLDAVLKRLQFDRNLLDESDIDQAIDRLRRGPEGGA